MKTIAEIDSMRRIGRYSKNDLEDILDILKNTSDMRKKNAIVRALALPCAKPTAIKPLLEEYRRAPETENAGLKWTIASALDVLVTENFADEIFDLIQDSKNGKSRELLVTSLGNINDKHVTEFLKSLLSDDDLNGFAIIGLRKQNACIDLELIKPFLKNKKRWIRIEAEKLLNNIKSMPE